MSKHEAEMQKIREYLEHWKRKLERCVNEKPAVLTAIYKLSKVPVTPEVLEITGILKPMSVLSNIQGEVGEKAANLLNKWKVVMDSQKRSKDFAGKMFSQAPVRKVMNQKPSNHYISSKSMNDTSIVSNKDVLEVQKSVAAIHQKDISSKSSLSRSHVFSDKFDVNRPCTSSTVSNNEINSSSHNSDLHHSYKTDLHYTDKNEDFISNPNLTISATESFDDSSDSPTKNKIVEPYSIEMKEGMFKVVKLNPDDIPPYILRVRQLYDKALIKNNREMPNKRERDKDILENEIGNVSPSLKSEDKSCLNAKKSKKNAHAAAINVKSDSPQVDCNFHSEYKNTSTEKSFKKKTTNSETHSVISDERLLSVKGELSSKSENGQKVVAEKKVKTKSSVLSKSVDKLKQQKSNRKENPQDKSESSISVGCNSLNAVESHPKNPCDKMLSDRLVLSDEDALRFATSKKERTSIYSGKKKLQDVPTLYRCCIQALKKNIDLVRFTKKVPYEVIKPMLQHCTPVQLQKFEEYNKHFMKDTNELWKIHCQRDHRDKFPDKYETWKNMYWRIHEEQNRKLKSLAANISASKSHTERQVKYTAVANVTHHPSPKQTKHTEHKNLKIVDSPVTRPSPKQNKHSAPVENKNSLKSSLKKTTATVPAKKPVKKETHAPLMSKVKKFMALTSKYKK